MNPSIRQERLDQEQRLDPIRFKREYLAEFIEGRRRSALVIYPTEHGDVGHGLGGTHLRKDPLAPNRIQAQAGPVSDQALEGIIFRAAHPIMDSLAPYPAEQRAALLPNVVRVLLASFLEKVATRR